MATSNLGHGLFVQRGGKSSGDSSGISPLEARKSLAGFFEVTGTALVPREGVLIGGASKLLSGSSSAMQVAIKPFTLALARQKNGADGIVFMSNIADSTVDIDPAPTAGSRIDVIYVAHNESTSDTTNSTPYFGVAKGTVGTPGTKPSVPSFAYELGSFTVSANITNLGKASITETWQYTGLRGTPIPVRSKAERDALTKRPQLQVMRTDRNNQIDTCDGTYWRGNTDWTDLGLSAGWTQVSGGVAPQWRFVQDGQAVQIRGEVQYNTAGVTIKEGWTFTDALPAEARITDTAWILGLGNSYQDIQVFKMNNAGKLIMGPYPTGKVFQFDGVIVL